MAQHWNKKNAFEFSDDDEEPTVQWRDATLGFGKYKGWTIESMLNKSKQRGYLRYLLKWDNLRQDTRTQITDALKYYESVKSARPVVVKPDASPAPAVNPN